MSRTHPARLALIAVWCAVVAWAAPNASTLAAQLTAAKEGRVVMGHVGLNSTSPDKHRAFWVALGGAPVTLFSREMFQFRNLYVSPGHGSDPTGGTEGTTVNHLGFQTANLSGVLSRMRAIGYAPVRSSPPLAGHNRAFFLGPDDVMVEVIERTGLPFDSGIDHIHFAGPNPAAMRDWYARVLGARPAQQGQSLAAMLPGLSLVFDASVEPVRGTAGRVLDHLSFEIRNLPQFCEQRQNAGVKFDRPYSKAAALDLGVAFLTDPWGTALEWTEGYSRPTH